MASTIALRALLGASLGLGAIDVAWLNLSIAPGFIGRSEPARPAIVAARAPEVDDVVPLPRVSEVAVVSAPGPIDSDMPTRAARPLPTVTRTWVFFSTRSTRLDETARARLARLVARGPSHGFVLDGHADHRGDEMFNRALSRQRALAVADELAKLGVERARIRIDFDGEVTTPSDRLWRDRRVDIQLTGETP